MDYRYVEPFPEPVSAATAHSPNRQPKFKSPMRKWSIRQSKKLFLLMYHYTGDIHVAAERAGYHIKSIYRWIREDPELREQYQQDFAMWQDIITGRLANLSMKSVDTLEDILMNSEDGRLKAEVAMKHLRSQGHMPDKTEIVHSGEVGTPATIREVVVMGPNSHRNVEELPAIEEADGLDD